MTTAGVAQTTPTNTKAAKSGLAISVRGLVKTYGDKRAVDGLDLDVERGEVFALLGPNGAGKTTTTEILEGYRQRDAGQVEVLGIDPQHGGRTWRSRIGIVLQSAVSSEELTVTELVTSFASFYQPRSYAPAEVIAAVGLQESSKIRVGRLSGGQRRRLDVALGIVGRPELLFLDEPTTGFDTAARREFWELIRTLAGEGTTILLTTHYLDEAEQLADRVAVIAGGRVVALDTPARLGGRATDSATVRWLESGVAHEVETTTPSQFVRELVDRFDGEVPELSIVRPTLEDTYLRLVGSNE